MVKERSANEMMDFASRWLEAWTGNQPEKLLEFYTDDAIYADPAHRDGLRGKDEIREYFVKLLAVYHDWVWKPIEVFPTPRGMVVKWKCWINVGGETIEEVGVDIVELREGRISRNEVYFDRTRLVELVERSRRAYRLKN
ncbi:MAG: nuclear transport factor 2 family protein [Candidatus Thorarchaeota archaeon]